MINSYETICFGHNTQKRKLQIETLKKGNENKINKWVEFFVQIYAIKFDFHEI